MENSKDSAPKSAGEHVDKTTEDTKSFMTSVGEQFDKTAESVTTFVKGALPSQQQPRRRRRRLPRLEGG